MWIEAVGFAAVKGTRHLTRGRADVGPRGLAGDRRWCLVDVERREVLRTARCPRLVALRAESGETPGSLRLVAPDGGSAEGVPEPSGETVTCDYWGRTVPLLLQRGPHAALASAWLGRAVRLVEAGPGDVVYGGAVSLVGAASVAALPGGLAPARFRANIVVAGGDPFAEAAWLGRDVHLGEVVVRPRTRTPRCVVVETDPVGGDRDAPVLASLLDRPDGVEHGSPAPVLGVDGEVVVPGAVRVGDPVRVCRAAPGRPAP